MGLGASGRGRIGRVDADGDRVGKLGIPSRKREAVDQLEDLFVATERRACLNRRRPHSDCSIKCCSRRHCRYAQFNAAKNT